MEKINFSSPEYLELLKKREHNALTQLIETYHEALFFGALKSNLSEDQAEEVVQSTWDTFFRNVENFQGRSHIRTYLFGIMYNKVKETWRSNKKYTQESDDTIDNMFDDLGFYKNSPVDPSNWAESKEFINILKEELEKIPENQRLAFQLKEVQGEKTEEICKILEVTSTNLGVLLYRAKNNLRVRLEKRLSR